MKIFDQFGADFVAIQGDGAFAPFWGELRYARAMCAGVTNKTFSHAMVERLNGKWSNLPETGLKVGVACSALLAKRVVYSASAVVCFAGVIDAAAFAAVGLFPRLTLDALRQWLCKITNADTAPRNPIYFNDIARAYPFGSSDYVSVLRDLTTTPGNLVAHIAQQVQANSAVAQRKYRWATWAMMLLAIDLVGLAALSTVIALKLS